MPPVLRAASVLVWTLLVALAGVSCGPGTAEQLLTPPASIASPDTGASPETLVPPAALDRQFEDTDLTREARTHLVDRFIAPVVQDQLVVAAIQAVPRHSFVPTSMLEDAYADHPLAIEAGQTISQPSLVAQMTETLEIDEGDRVLEIGTGSGYQAAILAQLAEEVYSVEIIPELAGIARAVLDRLGAEEVQVLRADGYFGWQEHAPYDAIIVTAAPDHLPQPLVQQLEPDGGRMVIPIGPVGDVQTLWLVTRDGEEVEMERLGAVRFVPFTREGASPSP
jgi:protein-L-isoaspartate(D-aspartate) O-methyltransferase